MQKNYIDTGVFDYIIIGAGSAGCVLAKRLGEDDSLNILVLEAGGEDNSIFVSMPTALSIPMNSKRFNWGLSTEPEPGLNGRVMNLPRGKGIGGSSSINGMCYVRGNPIDYELWSALGATGWHWSNVLPYFQRAEDVNGGGALRGNSGPLKVTRGSEKNPLYHAFINAGGQAGYALSSNMNQRQHEGFGPMEMTVGKGKRCSAAVAYLRPAQKKGNVTVLSKALVERVVFDEKHATAVRYQKAGKYYQARMSKEIILSAGAIMSPVILKRSGIGPALELLDLQIPVIKDAPQVGENLMDHLEIYLQQQCKQPVSLYNFMNPLSKAWIGARWLFNHSGLGATNHFESGAHIRSKAGVVYPDIQFHFLPLAISYDGKSMANTHGYQVHVGTKRAHSRGWVKLRDNDPQSLPKVCFNYLTDQRDWQDMRTCIRLTREIFSQAAFDPFRAQELAPGKQCQSDAQIDEFIKQNVESAYHPCGTCRMGSDEQAVVDPQCKVQGVTGLRVVDASIMPQATAGDLNAPTIMLAERAADMILGKPLMCIEDAPILGDENWQSCQRSSDIKYNYANDRESLKQAILANR
ncbi:MAG: choline dehydrogenase [Oceanospirillaceae bacterium]|jgi:choline dehydrogenase